ncbi:hypothetical protein EV421DRAFT_1907448 [Armillaria borealis]|uniref:Uncharacterized protein n=1 Tax=Armillaria borealis TaxID=47425 RepID=A0AA39J999_9AGAR|nr:hypothetical protein EV421DRAFT_1907448 [Armillaria borealis]
MSELISHCPTQWPKATKQNQERMDQFYSKIDTRDSIDALIKDRTSKDPYHLSRIHKDDMLLEDMCIAFDDEAQVWRLA